MEKPFRTMCRGLGQILNAGKIKGMFVKIEEIRIVY